MTQEEFIQKTMIAMMGNANITNEDNFDDYGHHYNIYKAALHLSNAGATGEESLMEFDDMNSPTSANFPDGVSERECFAAIAMALQAIANKKTINEQIEDAEGRIQ